jgi:F-type H+-transporting ATPase subunit O
MASFSSSVVRSFSTSTSRAAKLVKPPIAVFGLDGRYATALYSAAAKEKKLDAVEKELKSFQNTVKNDKKLREFIYNPAVQKQIKKEALVQVLKKLNASTVSQNLLVTLTENGRLKQLDGITNTFVKIMSAQRGEVVCEVVSAKPLDEATMKELQGALNGFVKKGETLHVNTRIDPSIIGGLIVSVGDKYVDMSIGSKIKLYTNTLKMAV